MPGGLNSTDRKLLVAASTLALLMAAATVTFAPVSNGGQAKVPSSYSSGPAGARAAFLLLQQLHYPVRRWEEPPAALPSQAVLILAEPSQMPSRGERASLLKFLYSGGRILFCGEALPTFFPGPHLADPSPGQDWKRFSSELPSLFTRGAHTITMDPKSSWPKLSAQQLALYGAEDSPVVVAWSFGRGELLWWAAATPLSNAGITQSDNLQLFLNGVSSSNRPMEIYWDEYFHGARASLWSYMAATPLKWVLVQFALIAALALFAFSRRWGPVAALPPVSRLSPLEFVDTLGGLYRRARATSVATTVAYRHLRLRLTRRLALPSSIADPTLAHAAGERLGWDTSDVASTLQSAAAAETHNLAPPAALKLVQQIATYTTRLESKRAPREKH